MREVLHLARRFFGSLSPRPIDPADEAWVLDLLVAGERTLWHRMTLADRKHAAGVARAVDAALGGADRPVVAAAALHDVGKTVSGFGTVARVVATVLAAVVGRRRLVERGLGRPPQSTARRLSDYLRHDRLGAELLEAAGSDPLTSAWAAEHHRPSATWTVPADIGAALCAADDD